MWVVDNIVMFQKNYAVLCLAHSKPPAPLLVPKCWKKNAQCFSQTIHLWPKYLRRPYKEPLEVANLHGYPTTSHHRLSPENQLAARLPPASQITDLIKTHSLL